MAGDSAGELAGAAASDDRIDGGGGADHRPEVDIVAGVLAPLLADGCAALHDRIAPSALADPTERPPIDHVLIAPSGVFVVHDQGWNGRLDVNAGALRAGGHRRTDELDQLVAQATSVSQLLDGWTGPQWTIPVWAVMCFAGEAQVGGWAAVGSAHAVDVAWLCDFVGSFEPQLGPAHVEWARAALDPHLARRPARRAVARPAPQVVAAVDVRRPSASRPAEAQPPAEASRPVEPPAEPIVYLSRRRDADHDRFYVRDEEGTPGGYLDLRTGDVHDASPTATAVLQQLLPHFLVEGSDLSVDFDPAARGSIRRFLDALRGRRTDSREIPLVACLEWPGRDQARLYAFRFQPGGAKTDLGWVDLTDGRTAEVISGVDPILRYCGDRYRSLPTG